MLPCSHTDALPTTAGIDKVDKLRFQDFLQGALKRNLPEWPETLTRLLQSMNLATDSGVLNLAGVLLFAERPELVAPQCVVKGARYLGNEAYVGGYTDNRDFSGPLRKVFDDALAFILRYLHKVQAGRGVNSPGLPEVPESVFEELLTNALVHRDYLLNVPIQIFIFDNRVEIISPGHLLNGVTAEKIMEGNSNIARNPILASYAVKGLLPYRGQGVGIRRALKSWPDIAFVDNREERLFTARIRRPGIMGETRGLPD
ncbi:Putative transcriptional regulator (fragment) [uncultured delta proteobacterium]|uniref:Putative transcriptional regulator n=1 Tax=uncultured delta proteobacterium TaxID=34034 RepID=A0A212K212_9DELT